MSFNTIRENKILAKISESTVYHHQRPEPSVLVYVRCRIVQVPCPTWSHSVWDKVRQGTKIRNRYNQVPHLTQDTTWESDKSTKNITNVGEEDSPFPAGDHKAAIRDKQTRNIGNKDDPQKRHRLGTVSKIFLLEGLNRFIRLGYFCISYWIY